MRVISLFALYIRYIKVLGRLFLVFWCQEVLPRSLEYFRKNSDSFHLFENAFCLVPLSVGYNRMFHLIFDFVTSKIPS